MGVESEVSSVGAACLSPKAVQRAALESRRDAMRDRHAAPTELEEARCSALLCYKHAVPTELLRNFSIY